MKRCYSAQCRYIHQVKERSIFSVKHHLSLAGNGDLAHTGGQDIFEKVLLLMKLYTTICF